MYVYRNCTYDRRVTNAHNSGRVTRVEKNRRVLWKARVTIKRGKKRVTEGKTRIIYIDGEKKFSDD